jgi:hypothetical protein
LLILARLKKLTEFEKYSAWIRKNVLNIGSILILCHLRLSFTISFHFYKLIRLLGAEGFSDNMIAVLKKPVGLTNQ